ncbi:MAG: RHS repeat-associated core domain-containing protein [Bacillota bacterium]
MVASYRYDAWGNILEAAGPLAEVNPYRYAGYRWDAAVGLYFLRTRYYDANLGRFLSRDVALGAPKNPQTPCPYPYGVDSPLRYVDPDGRWVWQVAGAVVGGCAGYALARSRGWGTVATVAATVVGAAVGH